MTDKELRRLSRNELLELLIQAEKRNERLQNRVSELEESLNQREIIISQKAGTLAEAALMLNGVLESADKAAAQYLENIKLCSEQQKTVYERIVNEAERKARRLLEEAEAQKKRSLKEADDYWNKLSEKLEEFYQEHTGLKEMITVLQKRNRKGSI